MAEKKEQMVKDSRNLSFAEKLVAIQSELKAPKSQRNDFGKYNYRSCEDIFEAVKPLLAKYGVVLVCSDDLVEVGGRNYVKATATLTNVGDDKASIHNCAYAREEETKKGMDGSQITGASSSYARKYALNGLFLIDDTRDSDVTNTHGKEVPEKEEKKETKSGGKVTERQMELIKKLVPDENWKAMLDWAGVEKLEDMSMQKASELIASKTRK